VGRHRRQELMVLMLMLMVVVCIVVLMVILVLLVVLMLSVVVVMVGMIVLTAWHAGLKVRYRRAVRHTPCRGTRHEVVVELLLLGDEGCPLLLLQCHVQLLLVQQ
jgi:hypothetical protein